MKATMGDNILSVVFGYILSVFAMTVGWIKIEPSIEIAFYGIIGGAASFLGKWIFQIIKYYFEKRFKKE